ncbi:hypothetical protein [Thiomicrorhabdus indica]|uniref:hypothetical protein n=1 Tax=Thiomicrorhabdus indica TaxID=2267253 RepID=UPI002AA8EB6F|nr:hypothetical protein [Thiomicrorhabdus indica]
MTIQVSKPVSTNARFETDLSNPVELNKLTSGLLFVLNIRGNTELLYLLGQPQAKDNKEALALWLTDWLKMQDWVAPDDIFECCLKALKRQLLDWQECV